MGIGVTCVILTGGIDLSIGSIVALAGVAAGMAVNAGVPVALGLVFGVFVGGLCGLANGFFVTFLKLPPFIATLGMMMIARGIALYITNAALVSGMPESFSYLGNGALFRIVEVGDNGLPLVKFPGIPYPVHSDACYRRYVYLCANQAACWSLSVCYRFPMRKRPVCLVLKQKESRFMPIRPAAR